MSVDFLRTGFSYTIGLCLVALVVLIADAATGVRSEFFDGSVFFGFLVGGWTMLYILYRKTTNQRTETP